MSSASILARKIVDEKPSVIRPATGPKPNSLTQKIAMITSWKVRPTTMRPRAARYTGRGARLRAAAMPSGTLRTTPTSVAANAICRLSTMPRTRRPPREKSGGTMRTRRSTARPKPASARCGSMLSVVVETTR